ncbi:MAG: hypothetical protein EBS94_13775, partial [Proteobacteria bacterium]|nr:hypothetical protein [Pseudomonadota bacterium]
EDGEAVALNAGFGVIVDVDVRVAEALPETVGVELAVDVAVELAVEVAEAPAVDVADAGEVAVDVGCGTELAVGVAVAPVGS